MYVLGRDFYPIFMGVMKNALFSQSLIDGALSSTVGVELEERCTESSIRAIRLRATRINPTIAGRRKEKDIKSIAPRLPNLVNPA